MLFVQGGEVSGVLVSSSTAGDAHPSPLDGTMNVTRLEREDWKVAPRRVVLSQRRHEHGPHASQWTAGGLHRR